MSTWANTGLPTGTTPPTTAGFNFWLWFRDFVEEELAPYPGRLSLVVRMVIAATITMLLIMTFRLPAAAVAGYYTLLLSRDSPQTTLRSALFVCGAYLLCASYCMIGIMLFIDEPLTHFAFVVFSLFLSFFVIRITTNYTAGAAFAFTIAVVIPLWDDPLPSGELVTASLWAATSVSVGLASTVLVEYVFGAFEKRDPLLEGVVDRLAAISEALSVCCGAPLKNATRKRVEQYGTVGVSRLRRLASFPLSQPSDLVQRSTVVSLVGRLVDLSNALLHLPDVPVGRDAERLRRIGRRLDAIQKLLQHGRRLDTFKAAEVPSESSYPLIPELERTLQSLQLSLTRTDLETPTVVEDQASTGSIIAPDAFSNRDHLFFALHGCLAASLCYVTLNAIAWHGLGTSLATCIVTALSTVGSSRQKQLLRLSGAMFGGLVLGIGSQVLILPMLNGIGGFTILFVAVTALAAWIATASPRISYFGLQLALAFYLIHLQEFVPQTSLSIARDRVMGVALGLAAMWLVFDRLGGRPAAAVMQQTFSENLRLIARLVEPWPAGEKSLEIAEVSALRERIHSNFALVNAQADAVLLEIGSNRHEHLLKRQQIRAWQPSLRSLFVTQVALLQYRIHLNLSEFAPELLEAQQGLDQTLRSELNSLAEAFDRRSTPGDDTALRQAYERLWQTAYRTYSAPPPRTRAILSLTSHLVELVSFLQQELRKAFATAESRP